jgi:hypothetical protein
MHNHEKYAPRVLLCEGLYPILYSKSSNIEPSLMYYLYINNFNFQNNILT